MAWLLDPAARKDIALEHHGILDGDGKFESSWLDSSGIDVLRVACKFNAGDPRVFLEEGMLGADDSTPVVVRTTSISVVYRAAYGEVTLVGRYFRVVTDSGEADNEIKAICRSV